MIDHADLRKTASWCAEHESGYGSPFDPQTILYLLDEIDALKQKLYVIPSEPPSCEQEWALVGPAIAFHLIERHAEDWDDAGRMMVAWRDATTEALKKDAERYHWLKVRADFGAYRGHVSAGDYKGAELDAVIDEAMSKQEGK